MAKVSSMPSGSQEEDPENPFWTEADFRRAKPHVRRNKLSTKGYPVKLDSKSLLPLFQAVADGKDIQTFIYASGWTDVDLREVDLVRFVGCPEHHRIKPDEPEFWVPWNDSDIPPVCWIKSSNHQAIALITAFDDVNVYCMDAPHGITYQELFDGYNWSTDLKTWADCAKLGAGSTPVVKRPSSLQQKLMAATHEVLVKKPNEDTGLNVAVSDRVAKHLNSEKGDPKKVHPEAKKLLNAISGVAKRFRITANDELMESIFFSSYEDAASALNDMASPLVSPGGTAYFGQRWTNKSGDLFRIIEE